MLLYLLQQMMGLIGIFVLTCDAKSFAVAQLYIFFLITEKKAAQFLHDAVKVVLLLQDGIKAVRQLQGGIRGKEVGVLHCLLPINLRVQVLGH